MAVRTDAIEGVIDDTVWFHYDLAGDVLYMRLAAHRDAAAVGEETPDGFILLRREADDQPIGLTIVNWWQRFGNGVLPDSIRQLETQIEPFIHRIAA